MSSLETPVMMACPEVVAVLAALWVVEEGVDEEGVDEEEEDVDGEGVSLST